MERLTEASLKWCSTYDIGRVAAKHFSDPNQFNGMTTELATWEGSVHDLASAMEEVTNQKTVGKLAMPKFFRRLFLGCLHNMCEFFEAGGALKSSGYDIEDSIQLIPSAFSAKDWFRFHLSNKGMLNISPDLYGKTWWNFIINRAASGG